MGLTPPEFSPSDNPASDSASLLTRTLTFLHLPAVNFWLLLCPRTLSFDWSMEAIPLVKAFDIRNVVTVAFYAVLVTLALHIIAVLKSKQIIIQANGNGCLVMTPTTAKAKKCEKTDKHDKHEHVRRRRNSTSSTESTDDDEHGGADAVRSVSVLILAIALMLFPFLPATNLFFYVGFVIAERVLYLPSLGFCLLVGQGAASLYERFPRRRRCLLAALVAVTVLMSVKTVARNQDWLSEERLYTAGIAVNPAKGEFMIRIGPISPRDLIIFMGIERRSLWFSTHEIDHPYAVLLNLIRR